MLYQLNDSRAKALVTLDAIFEHRLLSIAEELAHLKVVVVTGVLDFLPKIKQILARVLKKVPFGRVSPLPGKRVIRFMDALSLYPDQPPDVKVIPQDHCLVQYTGGTTGTPKGTVLTHRNLIANLAQINEWIKVEEGKEIGLSGFPFFHLAGLMLGLVGLTAGCAQVLIPDRPIITMNPRRGKKKVGTVGLPVQSTRVKLVDLETGTREVLLGEEGEIIAQGPQVMKGYLNKPDETECVLRELQGERWLYTGDVARMDEEGYVTIVDRTKDMLNVGGFKVFSREVEERLYDHPTIELCAIVGVPNPRRPGSELVKLVVQLGQAYKDGSKEDIKEDILSFAREHLSPYKIPKVIEFMDKLPLTPVGKVDKKAL